MALKDYIFETAFNPGTGPFAMLGPITGRKAFYPSFASGDVVMYGADDGTGVNWEVGWGVSSSGSPNNALTRNVYRNSAGTTSPINFTGTVEIICTIPSDRALFAHPSGYIDARLADLRNFVSINGGSAGGNRNRILNPKMDIWQAGTSLNTPASGSILADGYDIAYDGSGSTFTVSRQAVSDNTMRGQSLRRFMRIDQSVAGSGGTYRQLKAKVESVYTLPGRSVVVGFWARADSARSITLGIAQGFGTGGSPSANVDTSLGTLNLTTSWAWYQATATLPSIAGKTLGSNNDDSLALVIGLPVNTVCLFEFSDIHLMEGTFLPYQAAEPCSYAEALRRCQRYRTPLPLALIGGTHLSTQAILGGSTPVPMRGTPAVSWNGTGTLTAIGAGNYTSTTAPTVDVYDATSGALGIVWNGFAAMPVGVPARYTVAPSTALLTAWLP